MMRDISEWFIPEVIDSNEIEWASHKPHLEYAAYIHRVCERYHLSTVIEVGCGTGWVPTALDSSVRYLVGTDKNPLMVERCRAKNPNTRFEVCDVRNIGSLGIHSDLVCGFALMKHFSFEEWPSVLKEMTSIAKYALFTQNTVYEGTEPHDTPGPSWEVRMWHGIWPTSDQVREAIESGGSKLLESHIFRNDQNYHGYEMMLVTEREQ